jgi:hypothetical protein
MSDLLHSPAGYSPETCWSNFPIVRPIKGNSLNSLILQMSRILLFHNILIIRICAIRVIGASVNL